MIDTDHIADRDPLNRHLYREIEKASLRLNALMRDLPAPACDSLQLATVESGGARGDAIRALLRLVQRLNDFAHGSVALDETMAYGIGTEGGPLDRPPAPYSAVPDDRPR